MEQIEFKLTNRNEVYRIKKMNAIETLALKSQISFDTYDQVAKLYSIILEHIEVKCGDLWLTVKDKDVYYPTGIEEDVESIEELVSQFIQLFLKPVFQRSNESKA